MTKDINGFAEVINDDESLLLFIENMKEFDEKFCEAMVKGSDFTLRLEVHGNVGEILHVKTHIDSIKRPKGVEKRIEKKMGK